MTQTVYVSMDFETTGLDPDRHGPLSVAFCNDEFQVYSTMNPGDVEFDTRALDVNRFDFQDIEGFRPVKEVDVYLSRLLTMNMEKYGGEDERVIYEAVGLNVGNFDMQFLRKFLPNTYRLFSHRPFELNTLARTKWGLEDYKDQLKAEMDIIRESKGYSEDDLHDALVDAEICWDFFHAHVEW